MNRLFYIVIFFFILGNQMVFSQDIKDVIITQDTTKTLHMNPLAPTKAAFYSAILPGLGQVYNKKYWKVPLVYGALATSLYFYVTNNNKYNSYRDAYKRRLEGYNDDPYKYLDNNRLITAQRFYQRNRDLSLLVTLGFYILNIVDANVDAHLKQFNVNDRLSFEPSIYQSTEHNNTSLGLSLNIKF